MRRITWTVLACVMASFASHSANAQNRMSRWWVAGDALGYTALGFTVGLVGGAATEGDNCGFGPCGTTVAAALGGGFAGLISGLIIGESARKAIGEGKTLSSTHKTAVVAGTVLGAGTLGAIASSITINNKGPKNSLGSDEAAFTMLTLAGMAGGALFAHHHMNELNQPHIRVSPLVGKGTAGLAARVVF